MNKQTAMPRRQNDAHHKIQTAIVEATQYIEECRWLYAVPNGEKRETVTVVRRGKKHTICPAGRRLKEEGVKRGVLDLHLPMPAPNSSYRFTQGRDTPPYHGLFLEVKTGKDKLTPEQREFWEWHIERGFACAAASSIQQGIDIIRNYLDGRYVQQSLDDWR